MTTIPETVEEIEEALAQHLRDNARCAVGLPLFLLAKGIHFWLTALRAKIPPPPPPGAVPVRVAVAMTENGEYVAMGSSRYFIETAMKGAVGINKGKPAAIITAHIMPPRMAEVTGTVEQPQGDAP